jgi:DNA-binding response OmpR family regulator
MMKEQNTTNQAQAPILVVDDDYHLCQMVKWVLEDEGFEVQMAADGREAVERALLQQPKLILLDMRLPLLDGKGVAKQVHAHYGTRVPIILMSADWHGEEKRRQIEAVAYVRKPFNIDDLLQVVQNTLQRSA